MIVDGSEFADGERLVPDKALVEALAQRRNELLTALEKGEKPVYGVNTGMGRLAGVALDARQQAEHQRNLLIGRAVGGPPWLPPEDVRALLVVRLRDFLQPWSGVSPELVQFLVDRINDGFTPAVPRWWPRQFGRDHPAVARFPDVPRHRHGPRRRRRDSRFGGAR